MVNFLHRILILTSKTRYLFGSETPFKGDAQVLCKLAGPDGFTSELRYYAQGIDLT